MDGRARLETAMVVEEFITSKRARKCSAKYEASLRYGLGKLSERYDVLPEKPEEIEAVMAGVGGLADETRYDIWRVMKQLYKWAGERKGAVDAMAMVEAPEVIREDPEVFTQQEVDVLLFANERRHVRDYALLSFALDTGARLGEVENLRRSDISRTPDGYLVRLDGKRGKRSVPMSNDVGLTVLERVRGDVVWFSERTGEALKLSGLQTAVKRMFKRSNLSGGPHKLRHTFATLFIANGGEGVTLQRILGHTSFQMTQRYINMNTTDLQRQHAQFSPMAGRSSGGRQLEFLRVVDGG